MQATSATSDSKSASDAGIVRRSAGALKWNVLGSFARVASQFCIGVVLARLLGPEPFGLVAIAWLFLGLGNLVADFGLTAALIQRPTIGGRDIRYIFTLQMLAGALLTAAAFLAAPWLAAFFRHPDATPVLQAMGVLFVIQAAGQTAAALLKRNLDFRAVQTANVGSYACGYLLVGLPMAWFGFGVWSLAVAQLLQSTLYSLMVNLTVRHPMTPAWRPDGPGLFGFGSRVVAGNLTSWGISNVDAAIVGRVFGVADLGLYNRGMNLVATPMNALVSAVQGVLFSAYARAQSNRAAVRRAYLASLGLVSAVLMPLFAAVAAIAKTVVIGVYGAAWLPAAAILPALALAMPANAILALGGPVLLGLGRPGQEAGVQTVSFVLLALAVVVAASVSLSAVTWAVLATYVLRCFLVTRLAVLLVAVDLADVLSALRGPMLLAALAAAVAAGSDFLLAPVLSESLRLPVDLALAAVAVAGALAGWAPWILEPDALAIVLRGTDRVPALLRERWLLGRR